MRFHTFSIGVVIIFLTFLSGSSIAQHVIRGEVLDATLAEPLIGANVIIKGTTEGTITDFDGRYILETNASFPIILEISYTGFETVEIELSNPNKPLTTLLDEGSIVIDAIEVKESRILEKQKSSPLTVEALDLIAIKETPAADFYDGLGALKDVDLTKASLGFTIVNTRGFNSTNPVRSLQIIDGVDNQSPGLNFSLGNFLGASELDINKVELIVGASSAFYGPNAFNGVINMQTKDPFIHKGLAASVKIGERALYSGGFRYANDVSNRNGHPFMAYKLNFQYFQANDWEADNYDPVFDTETGLANPGGYDAVNIYGDEYASALDYSELLLSTPGLGIIHRRGYREVDLVDYDSRNMKISGALHFRLNPELLIESPELVLSSNFGGGTTVYQGDNRFSLRNIRFFQHRIELKKRDTYFIRAYATHEDAGDSYDPYFTALLLQNAAAETREWSSAYFNYFNLNAVPVIKGLEGYPRFTEYPDRPSYSAALDAFLSKPDVYEIVSGFHQSAQEVANRKIPLFPGSEDFFEPGTQRFQEKFDEITQKLSFTEGGTRFYDRSALVHVHGEYKFKNVLRGAMENTLDILVGGNGRIYLPDSKGSILLDTMGRNIDTYEFGFYTGGTYTFAANKLRLNASFRVDKHENFNWLFSPAASIVYMPSLNNYLRFSFSSAIRNPTLTDQYLFYNVGRATLLGNIDGYQNLITVESFFEGINNGDLGLLDSFDVDPIRPEQVRTFEVGYRTTLLEKLYLDVGGYLSFYKDFIGFQIGIDTDFNALNKPSNTKVYRVSSNAQDRVTTQGVSIGLNYYFTKSLTISGNYSYNKLVTQSDDPIIPAFNTPENKYNLSLSGRDITIDLGGIKLRNIGFNVNYKWIEGFIFEGSPQFTGFIPSYDLLDAQINWRAKKLNTTFKLGASNILDNQQFQTYGGPRVGRLAYFSITYDWLDKN